VGTMKSNRKILLAVRPYNFIAISLDKFWWILSSSLSTILWFSVGRWEQSILDEEWERGKTFCSEILRARRPSTIATPEDSCTENLKENYL
jgi:hypothetical protein